MVAIKIINYLLSRTCLRTDINLFPVLQVDRCRKWPGTGMT